MMARLAKCEARAEKAEAQVEALTAKMGASPDAKKRGIPAVFWAAFLGHAGAVSALVRLGADLDARGSNGWTALMAAARNGYVESARALLDAGADCLTLGDHAWDQREALTYIAREPRLLRPANYPAAAGAPGKGAHVFVLDDGRRVGVVQLQGNVFMKQTLSCPFDAVDAALDSMPLGAVADAIVVDMHCEATSEKMAMGHHCDGRASLVVGSHTHVPTADTMILEGGTAWFDGYMTLFNLGIWTRACALGGLALRLEGEGEVTTQLARGGSFASVVATEASPPMCRALRAKGFDLVVESTTIDDVAALAREANVRHLRPDGTFECVALLNVLDRCDAPFTLLTQLRSLLAPGGTLVLAVVIPFRPFVEDGKTHRPPRERLPLPRDGSWEDGANRLWRKVLKPAGFTCKRLARTPYICEGDQRNAAYVLDDAVFVLSAASGAETGAESVEDGAGI